MGMSAGEWAMGWMDTNKHTDTYIKNPDGHGGLETVFTTRVSFLHITNESLKLLIL